MVDELDKELRKCGAFLSLALCLVVANFAVSFKFPELPTTSDEPLESGVCEKRVVGIFHTDNRLLDQFCLTQVSL
ncbi:hypothetical protein [Laspinema palackyanum]|uniref:hypothetical protein n=1 Tax=Laspinema palackyanum TaxID=3231601 RepID=UPI00345DD033|nr:hypothetical protein [Laspinema sp. D2c]